MQPEILSDRPRIRAIPSSAIYEEGLRLDCNPYTQGAFEAKAALKAFRGRKELLGNICAGHNGGIFNGPQFRRNYVLDPKQGVPFLTSGSVLQSDLSDLPLLKESDAKSSKLAYLQIQPGMILITCSGSIGKMSYARPDMGKMWSSQDVMKVHADAGKILPGYLFAFLISKYGNPLVTASTYGAIIPHIEPDHLREIPVPRLSQAKERGIHDLVELASTKRAHGALRLNKAFKLFFSLIGYEPELSQKKIVSTTVSTSLQNRLDAFYYSYENQEIQKLYQNPGINPTKLCDVATPYIPGIFRREYASDPSYGVPYITGVDVFQIRPSSDRFLLKTICRKEHLVLKEGMILIQEAGQVGGLLGYSVLVGDSLDGAACSNNMIRVTPINSDESGYLFAALGNQLGAKLIARESAGSSIPHIEQRRVANIILPWPKKAKRDAIGSLVMEWRRLYDEADKDEITAQSMIEQAIGGKN